MTKESGRVISNREVKDSAFTAYFGEPENASRLYAALGDEEVTPDDITYVTLEGVLFVARKNDLAFTVKNRVLVISEHQSTINENMPLRDLLYLGRTLEKLLDERTLYKRRQFRFLRRSSMFFTMAMRPVRQKKYCGFRMHFLIKQSILW